MNKKEEIKAFLENRMVVGEETLKSMTIDSHNRPLLRRAVGLVIDKYIRDFQSGKTNEPRWVAIPGLRGVGKTTLIAQLYLSLSCEKRHKIYISLDEVLRVLNVKISDILDVYEEILGTPFERLTSPVFIFLDEVQYDDTWGLTLKTLYDRAKKVFVICTGSSALSLQTNPDIARRVVYTKIHPLNFTEFQMFKIRKLPIKNLGFRIREILFNSKTAEEVFVEMNKLQNDVDLYWKNIPQTDFEEYLKFGTMPFALSLHQGPLIYSQINQTLNSILNRDVPKMGAFDKQTIDKLSQILYAVASYDVTSFNKVSALVGLDIKTITSIFNAFEKAELLYRVYPNGSHNSQVKRASKYLFASPAFRTMYYNIIGSTSSFDDYKGKLLEDVVGLYLFRIFSRLPDMNITYDSAEGGADFLVGSTISKDGKIAVEVSLENKGCQQLLATMGKVKCKYGLVINPGKLWLDDTKTCVSIPLEHFLLA